MKFACPHCQMQLETDVDLTGSTVDCPACGKQFVLREPQPASSPQDDASEQNSEDPKETGSQYRPRPTAGLEDKLKKSVGNVHEKFNAFTGLEKLDGFSLTGLFSEIFGKHKTEDIEESFAIGTPSSTPPIDQVDTRWPKPWMFFRALAATIALYTLLGSGVNSIIELRQTLISGMLLMGTLAVPVAALLFFFEVNVRKNISLYQILKLVCVGGAWSMLVSTVIWGQVGEINNTVFLALAGPIEETAKLMVLVWLARSLRYPYKLNGLLLGAAIGTGFAVFESMESAVGLYADAYVGNFMDGIMNMNFDALPNQEAFESALSSARSSSIVFAIGEMKNVIAIRGMLSPFAHIVWTAIAGAALWRVKRGLPFKFSMLGNGKFWHLFLIPVVLHSLWDMPIPFLDKLPFYGKYLLLGFGAWFIVIALVQEGLKELRAEKVAAMESKTKEQRLEA